MAAATGAPTTQTPAPNGGRNTGAIIAALAAAVLILGIGVGVLLKMAGESSSGAVAPLPADVVAPVTPRPPAQEAAVTTPPAQAALEPASPTTPSAKPLVVAAPVVAKPAPRPQPGRPVGAAKPAKDKSVATPGDVGF